MRRERDVCAWVGHGQDVDLAAEVLDPLHPPLSPPFVQIQPVI